MENVIILIDKEIKESEKLKHEAWSCNDYSSYNEICAHEAWSCNDYSSYNEICAFMSGLAKAKQIIMEYEQTKNT